MRGRESGFTLVEIVCVLAIVALLAALALPAIPHGTSTARLNAYALQAAAMLTADRNAAIARREKIATLMDSQAKTMTAGASRDVLRFPADVAFDAIVAQNCAGRSAGTSIDFFASGMSCGGAIDLSRPGVGVQVRVNWLTGGVEVVAVEPEKN